ncbi:MAG: alanine racemase [Amaricoccus sp.]|uniref:alanine racemase n=1 Tax=Amaricoccus sp. TaxID=1872485 RepID=UPI0033156564
MARATLTIDLDAIAANWRALDARSGRDVETAGVLKADAYGLGAARVGPALLAAGARVFFVALAEEGAALRAALGPGPAIHVLSGLLPGDAEILRTHDLSPCLNSAAQVIDFENTLPNHTCAVQLDSGMHRLGLNASELASVLDPLSRLRPRLVLSHLACADAPDHPQNANQRRAFIDLANRLPPAPRSLAATGGVLLGPDYHFDLTRPGVGLFGGLPFTEARPAVTLALPVIQVREVATGGGVGYGAAWVAPRPSRVATLSAGYADGLLRAIAGGAVQLFAGERACPLIGRVSMDLVTVDVTDLADVPSHLEILNARQTVDDLARAAGTIGYEILTSLGDRYERVYKGAAADPGAISGRA